MNGASAVVKTLAEGGVEVLFANPGTTEMLVVEALDSVGGLRAVLCPHETVCTGAADGYARMAGKPAATLLHLGVGLANGTANLHNARRAPVSCAPRSQRGGGASGVGGPLAAALARLRRAAR